jgi:hypothetical protein
MKHSLLCTAAVLLAAMTMGAPAGATQAELGGGATLDFNAGADTLAVMQFSDGSTQEIKGGNGLGLQAGAGAIFFGPQQHRLETVLTIGVKFSTMQQTSNADLSFVRMPIELLAFYRNDALHFRVGGGEAYYAITSLTGSGAASALDVKFDPTFAGIVEADFVSKGFFAGLRYTSLSLHTPSVDKHFAASSIGVAIGYYYQFPGD